MGEWLVVLVPVAVLLLLGPRLPIWCARASRRFLGLGPPCLTRREALALAEAHAAQPDGGGPGRYRIEEHGLWYIIRPATGRGVAYFAQVHAFTGIVKFPTGIQR